MNLFLLRHASAGVRRMNPVLDVKRPLDKDGKRNCLQLAFLLNAMNQSFDLVVSSGLKRSLQTAQLVATETGYESKILISSALAPTATFEQFQRLVRECADYENVLMVGHNPNITLFLASLIYPKGSRPAASLRMRKATIARINTDRQPNTLQWLLDMRLVRALYATSTISSRRKTSRK